MKITMELSIKDFNAWSGAVDTKKKIISADKTDEFDELIEELYPDGIDATALNDILWFDSEWIFEQLGISEETEAEETEETEVFKIIKGHLIYISGTWCEITKNDKLIFEGSVKEGTTPEEIAEYLNI